MLTTTLKNQHAAIKKLLDEVRAAGIASDAGKKKLGQLKLMIIEHLKKEDTELYPALKANTQTRSLADTYAGEMSSITKDVIAFFTKYEGSPDSMEFARDLGRVIATLSARITREEVRLYPAFEQHCAG